MQTSGTIPGDSSTLAVEDGLPSQGPYRVEPNEPSRPPLPRQGWGWLRFLNFWFGLSLCVTLDTLWFRMKIKGKENIPSTGPYLILPNHSTFLDPFIIGFPFFRPLRFMASVAILRVPVLGRWLTALGAFPKMKYVKDKASMATTQALWDQDQIIMIFPEGRRTWDGDGLDMGEGIGRLIQRLDARVLFARLDNGYLMHPRWAKYPRYVRLELTYDGPYKYPSDWSPETITDDVKLRLTARQQIPADQKVWGFRTAHGLETLLWACMDCHQIESLRPDPADGDVITCSACGAAWRVDPASYLTPRKGGAPTKVRDAYRANLEFFAFPPQVPGPPVAPGGLVLSAPKATFNMVPRGARAQRIATGELRLFTDRFGIHSPDGTLLRGFSLSEVHAVSIEVGTRVQFRVGEVLYELEPGGESILKWGHFIKGWMSPGERVEVS